LVKQQYQEDHQRETQKPERPPIRETIEDLKQKFT
jgi:hypothetical protein